MNMWLELLKLIAKGNIEWFVAAMDKVCFIRNNLDQNRSIIESDWTIVKAILLLIYNAQQIDYLPYHFIQRMDFITKVIYEPNTWFNKAKREIFHKGGSNIFDDLQSSILPMQNLRILRKSQQRSILRRYQNIQNGVAIKVRFGVEKALGLVKLQNSLLLVLGWLQPAWI